MVPVSVLIALFIVGFIWYRLLTKMGFGGNVLWIMIVMLFFPFTALGVLIYLAFFPWPIHKQLKNVKAQRSPQTPSPSYQPVDEIDVELDRLRGDMGLNQMKKRKRET